MVNCVRWDSGLAYSPLSVGLLGVLVAHQSFRIVSFLLAVVALVGFNIL